MAKFYEELFVTVRRRQIHSGKIVGNARTFTQTSTDCQLLQGFMLNMVLKLSDYITINFKDRKTEVSIT